MDDSHLFLTPLAFPLTSEIKEKSEGGEKRPWIEEEEGDDELDRMSVNSAQSKRQRNEGKNGETTDEEEIEVVDLEMIREGGTNEMEFERIDEEVLEGITELDQKIRKMIVCNSRVKALCIDKMEGVDPIAKSFNTQLGRHMVTAEKIVRTLVLLLENKDLRKRIKKVDKQTQIGSKGRNIGTQSSPKGEQSREHREEEESNRKKGKGKKGTRNQIGQEGGGGNEVGGSRQETTLEVEEEWQQIERKKKIKQIEANERKKKKEEEEKLKRELERRERETKMKAAAKPRTEAIIIKTSEKKTFADLFKDLKKGAGEKLQGIQTIRKSRAGDLILEMEKNSNSEIMEKLVKETLGEEHKVKKMSPKVLYEIKDVDPTLERDEVREEIAKSLQTEKEEIEIKSIRFGFGGTKVAIINLPAGLGERIGEEREIKIGFMSCKMKRTWNLIRCYKCHEFGHMSYTCKNNLSGKEICRRCGTEGHQINNCGAIRCCILCTREGIPAAKAEHIAGAASCPQFRKYLQLANGREKTASSS